VSTGTTLGTPAPRETAVPGGIAGPAAPEESGGSREAAAPRTAAAAATAANAAAPAAPAPDDPDPRRWWVLAVLAITQLMVVLDATIVSIALPQIQARLHVGDSSRQWVVTAYGLTFGGLLLLGGRVADYWGRKRALIVAVLGFAAASAVGGFAVSPAMLFAARALQGAFGALLAPAVLSLLAVTFTRPKERATAFAVYGSIGAAGAALGLVLGGVLTEYLDWRWCLLVNVPFSLVVVVLAAFLVRPSRVVGSPRYDVPGAVLVTAGLAGLVYGFTRAGEPGRGGWTSPVTLAVILGALVLLAAFVLVESRTAHPLMPLRIIADRLRGGALLASLVLAAGFIGSTLFLTFYFQIVEHYSPVRAGFASLPLAGGIGLSATVAAKLLPRFGVRTLGTVGGVVAMAGLGWTSLLRVRPSFLAFVLPGQLVLGLGLGFVFIPLSLAALERVAAADAGVSSALLNATNQIGGSLGTALLNTVSTTGAAAYLAGLAVHAAPSGAQTALALVTGYRHAFVWGTALVGVAVLVVATMLRPARPPSLTRGRHRAPTGSRARRHASPAAAVAPDAVRPSS